MSNKHREYGEKKGFGVRWKWIQQKKYYYYETYQTIEDALEAAHNNKKKIGCQYFITAREEATVTFPIQIIEKQYQLWLTKVYDEPTIGGLATLDIKKALNKAAQKEREASPT